MSFVPIKSIVHALGLPRGGAGEPCLVHIQDRAGRDACVIGSLWLNDRECPCPRAQAPWQRPTCTCHMTLHRARLSYCGANVVRHCEQIPLGSLTLIWRDGGRSAVRFWHGMPDSRGVLIEGSHMA